LANRQNRVRYACLNRSIARVLTGLGDSLLGKRIKEFGLVARGVDEPVEQDLDVGVLGGQLDDLVGDSLGIGEGRNVLANTSKAQLDGRAVGSAELSLGLLTNDDEVKGRLCGGHGTDTSAHAGVNTTAETLVGRADDDEGLLVLLLEGLGLGRLVNLVGSLAIGAGVVHGTSGTGELGGGDNLHGVGDLLDVADGLEAALNLTKGGIGSSGSGSGNGSSARGESDISKGIPAIILMPIDISEDKLRETRCADSRWWAFLWLSDQLP
jgi:hypothetical protein